MSQGDRIKQFTNLYSMGLLPKIEGRYLTQGKRRLMNRVVRQSEFSIEKAKVRLNTELKKIQLSERINNRSERKRTQAVCFTEPAQESNRSEMDTIHVQSIEMQLPAYPSVRKAPSLFVYRKRQNGSLGLSDDRASSNKSPPSLPSQHPIRNNLKIKISKQPLDLSKQQDFSVSLTKWMETVQVQARYGYSHQVNIKRQQDGVVHQRHQSIKAARHMKLKLKYSDHPK